MSKTEIGAFFFARSSWNIKEIQERLKYNQISSGFPYRIVHYKDGSEKDQTVLYLPEDKTKACDLYMGTFPGLKLSDYKFKDHLAPGDGLSPNFYVPCTGGREIGNVKKYVIECMELFVKTGFLDAGSYEITTPYAGRDVDAKMINGVFVIKKPDVDIKQFSLIRYVMDHSYDNEGVRTRWLWARDKNFKSKLASKGEPSEILSKKEDDEGFITVIPKKISVPKALNSIKIKK
jgi:hypothetical protein